MSEVRFTIESVYAIRGRGILLLPGVTLEEYTRIRIGDALVIERPDGSILQTTVRGMEYPPSVHKREPNPRYGILVDLKEVPVGSMVTRNEWSPRTPPVAPADVETCPVLVLHYWAAWNQHDREMDKHLAELQEGYRERICFRSCNVDREEK